MLRCRKGNRTRSMPLSGTPSVQDSAFPGRSLGTSESVQDSAFWQTLAAGGLAPKAWAPRSHAVGLLVPRLPPGNAMSLRLCLMIRCRKGNRTRSMPLSGTPSVQDSAFPGRSLGTSELAETNSHLADFEIMESL
jgi:hypothetical protein